MSALRFIDEWLAAEEESLVCCLLVFNNLLKLSSSISEDFLGPLEVFLLLYLNRDAETFGRGLQLATKRSRSLRSTQWLRLVHALLPGSVRAT